MEFGGPGQVDIVRPRAIVCGDDFRHALHGHEYVPEAEGVVFSMMDTATRALLRRGFDVVVDETATTEGTIKRYLRIDRDAEPVWINTDTKTCIDRALATGKPYLVGPIERLGEQYRQLVADWPNNFLRWKEELFGRAKDDIIV